MLALSEVFVPAVQSVSAMVVAKDAELLPRSRYQ